MFMLITNCADLDRAEISGMSPSISKVALDSEARGEGVSWSRLMTMGTNIKLTILSIVTEIMTPKAFGEGRCWSTMDGNMNNLSGGGGDLGSIGKRLKKELVESKDFFVDSSILRLRFYNGRRESTSRGRGRRESRQKCRRGGHSRQRRGRDRQWRYRCRKFSLFKVMVSFLHGYGEEYSSKCRI